MLPQAEGDVYARVDIATVDTRYRSRVLDPQKVMCASRTASGMRLVCKTSEQLRLHVVFGATNQSGTDSRDREMFVNAPPPRAPAAPTACVSHCFVVLYMQRKGEFTRWTPVAYATPGTIAPPEWQVGSVSTRTMHKMPRQFANVFPGREAHGELVLRIKMEDEEQEDQPKLEDEEQEQEDKPKLILSNVSVVHVVGEPQEWAHLYSDALVECLLAPFDEHEYRGGFTNDTILESLDPYEAEVVSSSSEVEAEVEAVPSSMEVEAAPSSMEVEAVSSSEAA